MRSSFSTFGLVITLSFIIAGCNACSRTSIEPNTFTLEKAPTNVIQNKDSGVMIVSLHNLFGQLEEHQLSLAKTSSGHDLSLKAGGTDAIAAYLRVLSEHFPQNLIFITAGDLFGQSRSQTPEGTLHSLNDIGVDFVSITPRSFREMAKMQIDDSLNLSVIGTNLVSVAGNRNILEGHSLSKAKIITANETKVAFLSVSFPDRTLINSSAMTGLIWEDPVLSIIKERSNLQRESVDFVVLSVQANDIEEVETLIKRLPPYSVDLILLGGIFEGPKMIQDIPVVFNQGRGKFIELNFLSDKTKFQSTVKLCHNFYELTSDCFIPRDRQTLEARSGQLEKNSFKTKRARFFGQEINL